VKKVINIISFIAIIFLGRIWIEYDQIILPKQLLMPAFLIILMGMVLVYFYVVKPRNVKKFAFWLSCTICIIAIALSLLQHVVFHHDFWLYWKHSLIIWGFSLLVPNLIGFVYSKLNQAKKAQNSVVNKHFKNLEFFGT
jgi:hypothetical protein